MDRKNISIQMVDVEESVAAIGAQVADAMELLQGAQTQVDQAGAILARVQRSLETLSITLADAIAGDTESEDC